MVFWQRQALRIGHIARMKSFDPSVRYASIIFLVSRLVLSIWAILILAIRPLPAEPNETLRPYLGQEDLRNGASGLLLGPWQRFDTMRYLSIAESGYEDMENSVFPPLYPIATRFVGLLFGDVLPASTGNLLAAIIISNLAFLGSLILLFRLTAQERDEPTAKRSVVYLAIFPTAFFLLAAYTESMFLFMALIAIWAARQDRFWRAGVAGLLASLTRLTGWVLVVPLGYEYLRQRSFTWRRFRLDVIAVALPLLGTFGFLAYRWLVGLPNIDLIYRASWHQTTGLPGSDLITALRQMFSGVGEFRLFFDFFCAILLIATTIIAFYRLGVTFGLYSTMLLLFMLLPVSELKPLYSFSRYALVFFPTFILLGMAGRNPWFHRLIAYPSIALYLYFSGQFFMWGWVA